MDTMKSTTAKCGGTATDIRAIYACRYPGRTTKAQRAHAVAAVTGCVDVDAMPDMVELVLRGNFVLACPRCIVL